MRLVKVDNVIFDYHKLIGFEIVRFNEHGVHYLKVCLPGTIFLLKKPRNIDDFLNEKQCLQLIQDIINGVYNF